MPWVPRQHGGVVGHDGGAAGLGPKLGGIDAAQAGDHAVGRSVERQVFGAAATGLGGHGQRAVFDEAAFVAQIGDVFSGGAQAQGMAFGHGLGAVDIQGRGVAVLRALQVGARA
jgi:hypothetical protein